MYSLKPATLGRLSFRDLEPEFVMEKVVLAPAFMFGKDIELEVSATLTLFYAIVIDPDH